MLLEVAGGKAAILEGYGPSGLTVRSNGVEVTGEVLAAREEVEDCFLEAGEEVRGVANEDESLGDDFAE